MMDDAKKTMLTPPKVPCGTCPYRVDVPSGVWEANEYEKLGQYDKEMWLQPLGVFMCHQRDGCLCGGWLKTHGAENLLSLRLAWAQGEKVDASVWDYDPPTEVFGSGAEAAAHGMAEIDAPGAEAMRKIAGLMKQRGER